MNERIAAEKQSNIQVFIEEEILSPSSSLGHILSRREVFVVAVQQRPLLAAEMPRDLIWSDDAYLHTASFTF